MSIIGPLQIAALLDEIAQANTTYRDETQDYRGCSWFRDGELHFGLEENGLFGRVKIIRDGADTVTRSRESFAEVANHLNTFMEREVNTADKELLKDINWDGIKGTFQKLANNYHAQKQYKALKKILLLAKSIDRLRGLVRVEEETLEALAAKSDICELATKNVVLKKIKEYEDVRKRRVFNFFGGKARRLRLAERGFESLPSGKAGYFQRERARGLMLRLGSAQGYGLAKELKEDLCVKIIKEVQSKNPEVCSLIWNLDAPEERDAEIFAVTFEPCMRNFYTSGLSLENALRVFSEDQRYSKGTLPEMFTEAQIKAYYQKADELKTTLRTQVKANAHFKDHFTVDEDDNSQVDIIINHMFQKENLTESPLTEAAFLCKMDVTIQEYTASIALFKEHVKETLLTDEMLVQLDRSKENINAAFRKEIVKKVIATCRPLPKEQPYFENLIKDFQAALWKKLIAKESHLTPENLLSVFPLDESTLAYADYHTTAYTQVVEATMDETTNLDFGMSRPLALAILQQGNFLDKYGALVKTVHFDADWATVCNANLTAEHRVPESDPLFKEKVFALTLLEFLCGAIPEDWNASDPRRIFLETKSESMDRNAIEKLSKDKLDWLMQCLLGHYRQSFPQRITPPEIIDHNHSLGAIENARLLDRSNLGPEEDNAGLIERLSTPQPLIDSINHDLVREEKGFGKDVRFITDLLLDLNFSNQEGEEPCSYRRSDEVSFVELIHNPRGQTHLDLHRAQYQVKKSDGGEEIIDFGQRAGQDRYGEFCEILGKEFDKDPNFVRTALLLINQSAFGPLHAQCFGKFSSPGYGFVVGSVLQEAGTYNIDFQAKKVTLTWNFYLRKMDDFPLCLAKLPVKVEYTVGPEGNGTLTQELLRVEQMPDFATWRDEPIDLMG